MTHKLPIYYAFRLSCALILAIAIFTWLAPRTVADGTPALSDDLKANLIGWFDASDSSTLTVVGGGIQIWKDKSGSGHDLSQPVAIARPKLAVDTNMPVVTGGGSSMLTNGLNESLPSITVYALVKAKLGNTPIIGFSPDGKGDTLAAGWTVGAHPTWMGPAGQSGGTQEVEDDQWHLLTFRRDGADRAFYVDGVLEGHATVKDTPTIVTDFLLFDYPNAADYRGSLAELLIYKSAQSDGQMKQVVGYLKAKWKPLFADPKSDLVTFVGNSITTSMYCGSGQTWTKQTVALIPSISHWYSVCKGGITTSQLAGLAPDSIDPLLAGRTGRSVLVLFEGTNELIFNNQDAGAAFNVIKQFCRDRRAAGWQKIVVLTILPRQATPAFETARIALNDMLRQHYAEFADALVDVGADPVIGVPTADQDRLLYLDGTHTSPKANGIIATLVAPKVSQLLTR